jgi:hypothetical protein
MNDEKVNTEPGCPAARCNGLLVLAASGVDADGRQLEYLTCDTCGRFVERQVPLDHPALPGMEVDA